MASVQVKELAMMVDGPDLFGIRIAVVLWIRGDGIICPGAFPESALRLVSSPTKAIKK